MTTLVKSLVLKIIAHPEEVKMEDLIEAYQVVHDLCYEVELTTNQQQILNNFIERGLVKTHPFMPWVLQPFDPV